MKGAFPHIQFNGATRNKKQFPGSIIGINDLSVVVFHQTIKEIEITAAEYEQPGCLQPLLDSQPKRGVLLPYRTNPHQ